jgi:hypothetical protein
MRLNEDLFQRSTATRHHPPTDRKFDRLTWTHTAPMGFTGWSQRDTLTTGHGHCRDNAGQATGEAHEIIRALRAWGISRLHGFGVKTLGLQRYGHLLTSADSLAWSEDARRKKQPACGTVHPRGGKNCANCFPYAMTWRARLLDSLTGPPRYEQLDLFDKTPVSLWDVAA